MLRIAFDANQLGIVPDGAPPVEILHRDLLLEKPLALLVGRPRRRRLRAFEIARARGVTVGDTAELEASPVYGAARRSTFEAAVREVIRQNEHPTVVIDEARLVLGRVGPLVDWLHAIGLPVRSAAMVEAATISRG